MFNQYSWSHFYCDYCDYGTPQPEFERIFTILNKTFSSCIDLGAGKGRHLKLLNSFCKNVDALDIKDYGLKVRNFIGADITKYSFKNFNYDLVFSNGLFHHLPHSKVQNLFFKLNKSMPHKSYIAFNLHSKLDYKYSIGKKIDKDTFIYDQGKEKGQIHSFWSKEDILELLRSFKVKSIFLNKGNKYSCWYILAYKESKQ